MRKSFLLFLFVIFSCKSPDSTGVSDNQSIPQETEKQEKVDESPVTNIYNVVLGKKLDDYEVQNFRIQQIMLLRNLIFARYNYKFKSDELLIFFQRTVGYKPENDDVSDQLTEIDQYNINFLLEKENEMKKHFLRGESLPQITLPEKIEATTTITYDEKEVITYNSYYIHNGDTNSRYKNTLIGKVYDSDQHLIVLAKVEDLNAPSSALNEYELIIKHKKLYMFKAMKLATHSDGKPRGYSSNSAEGSSFYNYGVGPEGKDYPMASVSYTDEDIDMSYLDSGWVPLRESSDYTD